MLLEELDYTVEYKPDYLHKHTDHLLRYSKEVGMVDIDDELSDDNLCIINVLSSWYVHIAEFLTTQTMPEGLVKNKQRKLEFIIVVSVTMSSSSIISTKRN